MSRGDAEYLLGNALLNAAFDALEKSALEGAVHAPMSDDETRRALLGEVRAIRSVRRKLRQALTKPADDTGA